MVTRGPVLLLVFLGGLLATAPGWAQDDKKGPVLYGDGGGRIWKWESGAKTDLTAEGQNLILGGVGEKQLWGWAVDRDTIRFFTLDLPKKKDSPTSDPKAKEKPQAPAPVPPRWDSGSWPAPDRADRVDDRRLLVYGALSGQGWYEVWQKGQKVAARAWDDGRVVYAVALGRDSGWIVAGRASDGSPWLDVSGTDVPSPEGWRGRLTVAAWVAEEEKTQDKQDEKPAVAKAPSPGVPAPAKAPPPVHPWAAGWGAPGVGSPRALFWGPEGWTQPAESDVSSPGVGTYPVLGQGGDKGTLTAAGWMVGPGAGDRHPWFWDGKAETVTEGTAEGEPQVFSLGGKGGAFLVVRHGQAPWFTQEDGKSSVPLEGLGPEDRVVSLENTEAGKTP
jgi:hypothetical protein